MMVRFIRWLSPSTFALWTAVAVAQPTETALPLRDRVELGAYVTGIPYSESGPRELAVLEQRLGTKLSIVSGFVDWDYVLGGPRDLELAQGGERVLLYSWEPQCEPENPDDCIDLGQVARGEHDAYLLRVAESMRRFPYRIYVRPWAEMNAEWSPWQPGSGRARAGTHEEFVKAWHHMRDLFRRQGVDNLLFVFNVDASDWDTSTRVPAIWPGSDYVDVLGIDGYNWGRGKPGGPGEWREFEAIFAPMYRILTELHPDAPVWICEFGSKEPTKNEGTEARPAPRDPEHDKGAWYEAMLGSTAFPRLTALVHFNVRRERDFRFESSPASLRAVRRQLRLRSRARCGSRERNDTRGDASRHSVRTSRSCGMPASSS